jgi:pimeloyl-ACP methyl ester carboxylesterase
MATNFLFQHGAMVGGFVWDEAIAAVQERSEDARCLALDVPGCGAKRGRDVREMPFDDIVTDLLADIDASRMSDIVLVGHSQGGTLLPRLVEARPGLFRKLVYIACLAPAPGQSVMEAVEAENAGEKVKATTIMEGLRSMLCNDMDVPTTRDFLARLGGGDAWPPHSYAERNWRYDQLKDIPSTYIFCNQDQCVPPAKQDNYLQRLQLDRVIRIDSGHQPMNSRPGELADLLVLEAG